MVGPLYTQYTHDVTPRHQSALCLPRQILHLHQFILLISTIFIQSRSLATSCGL